MHTPQYFEMMENYAICRPIGSVSLNQGVEMVTAAITFSRERKICKLLMITSGLTGFDSPSLFTRYAFFAEWAHASGGFVRVAIVARPEMIDSEKFGVTVGLNRGLKSDVFTSEEEALAWLQSI